MLAHRFAEDSNLDADTLFMSLCDREKLGSTGVGHGVGIPHARSPLVEKVTGIFVQLHEPIAFDSVDDEPVDLIFSLLAPEGPSTDHLKSLSKISRLLRNEKTCEKLRATRDPNALFALLLDSDTQSAA